MRSKKGASNYFFLDIGIKYTRQVNQAFGFCKFYALLWSLSCAFWEIFSWCTYLLITYYVLWIFSKNSHKNKSGRVNINIILYYIYKSYKHLMKHYFLCLKVREFVFFLLLLATFRSNVHIITSNLIIAVGLNTF